MTLVRTFALAPPLTIRHIKANALPYGDGFLIWFADDLPDEINDGYIPRALFGAITLLRIDQRLVASGLVDTCLVAQPQIEPLLSYFANELMSEDGAEHCSIALVQRSSGLRWSGEEDIYG